MSLQAGECQCMCSLTPAGRAGARLPAVDLPEALRNIIPLRHGVMRSVSTVLMTEAVGKTLLLSGYMMSLDIKGPILSKIYFKNA